MAIFVKAADCDAFEQVIVETRESRSVRILGYFKCDQRSGATCRLFICRADCGGLRH